MAIHVAGEKIVHPAAPPAHHETARKAEEERSAYGSIPGSELPGAVYISALFAFFVMLFTAWLAFGSSRESDLNLGIVTVLSIIALALPAIIARVAFARSRARGARPDTVETATGTLSLPEASVQILLIPVLLACAAVAFGLVYVLAR